MEWTDALGAVHTGQIIPTETTDTTGAALPAGEIRWRNLGTYGGTAFDLVVTVSSPPSEYSETVDIEYVTPMSRYTSQAVFTSAGYACLGFGLRTSYCFSGGALDPTTASCADGTPTAIRAAEFDFRFVVAGTAEPMTAFSKLHTTFFDVDGDTVNGGSVFELDAVDGAYGRYIAPSAEETLEAGTFELNEALYAIATQQVNVPTDFSINPATPADVSLPAIVRFDIRQTSSFKVLLGGRSSVT